LELGSDSYDASTPEFLSAENLDLLSFGTGIASKKTDGDFGLMKLTTKLRRAVAGGAHISAALV
jgi:hypothetical protein